MCGCNIICIHKYTESIFVGWWCTYGCKADHFALNNWQVDSFLEVPNSSLSSHVLPEVLCLGVKPMKISLSTLKCPLTLSLLQSCLCSHFWERMLHNRLDGILTFIIIPHPLQRCSLSHWSRSFQIDIFTGAVDLWTVPGCGFQWCSPLTAKRGFFDEGF